MGIRFPGTVLAKQIFRQSVLSSTKASTPLDVPKGYLAVYIPDAQKRFIIPVSYLNKPTFQTLLNKAEEEYGFDHPMGGLTIPCREETFITIISQLSRS